MSLRIDDLPLLPDLSCIIPAARAVGNLQVSDQAKGSGTTMILGFTTMVLLCFLWRTYRKGRSTALLLCFVGGTLFGCGHHVSPAAAANAPILSMPAELPVGEISGTGQVVTVDIDVVSQSAVSHSIDISTSCGCVGLSMDEFVISGGESTKIPLSISTLGRNGPFSSEITFLIDDGTRQTVQVQGVIRQQVFAIPSSLSLARQETTLNGTLKISAPLDTWPDLYVECSDSRFTIQMGEDEGELREFRIDGMVADESRRTYSINVLRKGQPTPVLQVPMFFPQ